VFFGRGIRFYEFAETFCGRENKLFAVLGYANTSKAINAHCKAINTCHTEMGGQVRAVQIIPERDMYRLVMKSKLPARITASPALHLLSMFAWRGAAAGN